MIGTTIGPYEIRAALGAGGMGEVYRARDSKLGRDVALKILPPSVAADHDRVARFRREAQLLASLNHPNIAAIHGLEELGGVPVLVLELVDGQTLADRLVHGPIPSDEAFTIAQQIAQALEAAHEHGIIHRDLKPANIKLRSDGMVKVLDFGLAKALEGPAEAGHDDSGDRGVRLQPDRTASPTITSPAMTRLGVIMGTAAYMSPEQARGRSVDRGADIWAWGCVLFEMLTGRRAFDGADTTEVIAAVVRGEPDWTRLPHDTPADVRRVLRRCLEKDPRRRLADIRDARFTLEDLGREPATTVGSDRHSNRERLLWAAALLVCIAGSTALFWRAGAPSPSPSEMRVEVTTPPTTDPVSIALSPDGERLAFIASFEGRSMLWVRSLANGEAAPLANTEGASLPFWSPDSRSIGFFANDRLYRIDADGGALKDLAPAPVGTGGTWSRAGDILFTPVPDGPVARVAENGGPVAAVPAASASLTDRNPGHRYPQFLPDGRHFLYYIAEPDVRGIYLGSLDAPDRRRLFDADAAAVVMSPDRIVFLRANRLYVQRFDTSALTAQGDAVPLTQGIVVDATGALAASASAVGSIIYRTGTANRPRQLAWFDRAGKQIDEPFAPDSELPLNPAISPDGRQIVLSRSVGGNVDLWLQDLTRNGARTRLTTAPTPDIYPVWSPDGRRIAYGSPGTKSAFGIAIIPAAGGETSMIYDGPSNEIPVDWSRDGLSILYRIQEIPGGIDLWALPVDGARQPFAVSNQPNADERFGAVSPDGRWVAVESNESGRYEVYVQAFPESAGKTVVSTMGGSQARWSPDGKELFYVAPDAKLMAVALRPRTGSPQMEAASPVALFRTSISGVTMRGSGIEYDISSDGKRFLMNTLVEQPGTPITLVLNAALTPHSQR
jgi:eukaryotic-like serine/threonine-protein kinase